MVLRSAACASVVRASASSRKRTLNVAPASGDVRANSLIWFLTTSIPRSSEAFISRKFICQESPKSSRASATAAVVLPTPALPVKRRCGRLPVFT